MMRYIHETRKSSNSIIYMHAGADKEGWATPPSTFDESRIQRDRYMYRLHTSRLNQEDIPFGLAIAHKVQCAVECGGGHFDSVKPRLNTPRASRAIAVRRKGRISECSPAVCNGFSTQRVPQFHGLQP